MIMPPRPTTWVALTGFMGVGKSRVGKEVAKELMLNFIDLDRYIEHTYGLKIPEIFAGLGAEGFRALEREAVREVVGMDYLVVALGGGTFIDPENRALLLARGPVVSLWADPEVIYRRVKRNLARRPLLNRDGDPKRTITELLAERQDAYREASVQVDSGDRPASLVAREVIAKLWGWNAEGRARLSS